MLWPFLAGFEPPAAVSRGDQLIVAAGSFYALTAIICPACIVAGTVAAAAFQAISNRGYICPKATA
jgi:hypothetical protein